MLFLRPLFATFTVISSTFSAPVGDLTHGHDLVGDDWFVVLAPTEMISSSSGRAVVSSAAEPAILGTNHQSVPAETPVQAMRATIPAKYNQGFVRESEAQNSLSQLGLKSNDELEQAVPSIKKGCGFDDPPLRPPDDVQPTFLENYFSQPVQGSNGLSSSSNNIVKEVHAPSSSQGILNPDRSSIPRLLNGQSVLINRQLEQTSPSKLNDHVLEDKPKHESPNSYVNDFHEDEPNPASQPNPTGKNVEHQLGQAPSFNQGHRELHTSLKGRLLAVAVASGIVLSFFSSKK